MWPGRGVSLDHLVGAGQVAASPNQTPSSSGRHARAKHVPWQWFPRRRPFCRFDRPLCCRPMTPASIALDVGVGPGCLGMGAEIIAEHQQRLPPRTRQLHHMHMMGPWAGRPLAEEQFAGQPRHVFRHVGVAKRLDRRDPSLFGLLQAGTATSMSMIGFDGRPGNRGAARVLDG